MRSNSIEGLYNLFLQHPVICCDTRNIIPDSIFFALKGANFNANKFAKEALSKGCSYAVIDEESLYSEGCILVHDVLKSLQKLANHHRKQFAIPVIGITGTNGKTTTKELTATVLSKKYNTLFTKGNLNNHIGVPLTLLNLTKEHGMAVIEMGANHIGEIEQLCLLAEPDFGIITNIGKAHLEGFGSYEGVIKAKSELYKYVREREGRLFVNADDDLLMKLSAGIDRITYGTNITSNFKGIWDNTNFMAKGKIISDGQLLEINSNLAGSYNFYNILAGACIGKYFEVPPEQIKEAIEGYVPSNNRSQIVKKGNNTIWVDAYNANPSSMKNAIENFTGVNSTGKILILGDMFELGDESLAEHQAIADLIEKHNDWSGVYLIGKEFKQVKSSANLFTTIDDFIKWFTEHPIENSTVLLKGSRGMQMEKVLEKI
jgi:UDP-N-acetylmuramoyl-tripeptide--D-alanyl-D-alanine ligase